MKYFDGSDFSNTPVSSLRPHYPYTLGDDTVIPAVSIITPFFNTGVVFYETYKCVLAQTLQQWEWVIVNDGSNDKVSLQILNELRNLGDYRIRIFEHDINQGLSFARNTGFSVASAPLIFMLDSDDLIESTTLEKLAWSLVTKPESSFVSSFTVGFGAQNYLWTRGFHEERTFLRENLVTTNCMIRKQVQAVVGGFDEKFSQGLEDWDFWLRCADAGYWGHTVTEFLDWYRRRESHTDRWTEFGDEGIAKFRRQIGIRFPTLKLRGFPKLLSKSTGTDFDSTLTFANILAKEKKRILLILPWLVMGGADHFNLSLVRELTARGYEITIATTVPGEDGWCHEFARFTSDIFMLHRFLDLKDFPRFLRYLIDSRQPDYVLVSNSELGYLLLPYLKHYCSEPVYLDYCHMEELEWRQGGFPALSIQFSKYLDATMVASLHLKKWMLDRGGDDSRIHICRINIDAKTWCQDPEVRTLQRNRLGIDENTVVILYAARLCRQKLPLFFAEIIRELSEKTHSPFVSLVVGDGEDGPALERFVKRNRLQNRIRLLGRLPIEQMRSLMAAVDIFLLPSQNEGISLAIYEAMASGVCVVGADVGGQKELVVDGTGILLPSGGDSSAKKHYVEELKGLLEDPSRRMKIARAARERIENNFQLEQMVDNFESICRHGSLAKRQNILEDDPLEVAEKAVQYIRAFGKDRDMLTKVTLPIKTRVYAYLTRVFGPLYFWCLEKRYNWVITLKDLVRKCMGVDAT